MTQAKIGYVLSCFFVFLLNTGSYAAHITLVPPSDKFPESYAAIEGYANNPQWGVNVKGQDGNRSLELVIPSPFTNSNFLSNSLASSILPLSPTSSIFRFKYLDINTQSYPDVPFQYVEVDWNMEGKPRGPNGSFITPHYDFHFYTKSQDFVEESLKRSVTNAIPCDPAQTGYRKMRPFLALPPAELIPEDYYPDVGSSIAAMGLHNLDGTFEYTIENVKHNPAVIYGTFDNELLFFEASITLYTFQDAIHNGSVRWNVKQPQSHAYGWWPQEIILAYDETSRTFVLTLV